MDNRKVGYTDFDQSNRTEQLESIVETMDINKTRSVRIGLGYDR